MPSTTQHTTRLPYHKLSSKAFMGLVSLSEIIKKGPLGARLTELVFLRVSQINGCAYCMDMHWSYLVKDGMDPRHLNAVAGWREAPFFGERERAAFRWAEIITATPTAMRATRNTPGCRRCSPTQTSPSWALPSA